MHIHARPLSHTQDLDGSFKAMAISLPTSESCSAGGLEEGEGLKGSEQSFRAGREEMRVVGLRVGGDEG